MRKLVIVIAFVSSSAGAAPARKVDPLLAVTSIRINATEIAADGKHNRRIVDVKSPAEVAAILDALVRVSPTADVPTCRQAFALELDDARGKPVATVELCDDGVAGRVASPPELAHGLRIADLAAAASAMHAVGVAFPVTHVIAPDDLIGTWSGKVTTTLRQPADHLDHTPASEHTEVTDETFEIARRGGALELRTGGTARPLQLVRERDALVDASDHLSVARYAWRAGELVVETEIKGHFGGTSVGRFHRKLRTSH
jgi:hypothetical protein